MRTKSTQPEHIDFHVKDLNNYSKLYVIIGFILRIWMQVNSKVTVTFCWLNSPHQVQIKSPDSNSTHQVGESTVLYNDCHSTEFMMWVNWHIGHRRIDSGCRQTTVIRQFSIFPNPIIHCVYPPKFYVMIIFNFSRDMKMTKEK